MSGDSREEGNDLATFTEEGHERFMEDNHEELPPAVKKKRGGRSRKSKAKKIIEQEWAKENPEPETNEWEDMGEVQEIRREPEIEQEADSWWAARNSQPTDSFFSFGNPFFSFSKHANDVETENYSTKASQAERKKGYKAGRNVTNSTDEDDEAKQKRKLIYQITRYKEKFNLKLRKSPNEKMSIDELEEIKSQARFQVTEKEGSRMIKTLYVGGMTAVDNLSQAAGRKELRNLGKVAEAVANDEENELLWEELGIEFKEFLHVSPQRELLRMTAKVLLTTVKINTDPNYAAFMQQQMNVEAEALRNEFPDV